MMTVLQSNGREQFLNGGIIDLPVDSHGEIDELAAMGVPTGNT